MADKHAKGRHRGAPAVLNANDLRWAKYLRSLGASYQRIVDIVGKLKSRSAMRAALSGRYHKKILSSMEVCHL